MPISIDKEVAESGQLPACWKAREALIDCLMQSACIRKEHKTPEECLHAAPECSMYKNLLFNCRRTMLDARSRFRGRVSDQR